MLGKYAIAFTAANRSNLSHRASEIATESDRVELNCGVSRVEYHRLVYADRGIARVHGRLDRHRTLLGLTFVRFFLGDLELKAQREQAAE